LARKVALYRRSLAAPARALSLILLAMRLPSMLRRLLGRERPIDSKRARYTAADDLERKTQSHYRAVTGVDSEGRATKSDRNRPSGPR